MPRVSIFVLAAALVAMPRVTAQQAEPRIQTWTGWVSDKRCAKAPAPGESMRPNGTECVKRCLNDGSTPVFLSEQANALYEVHNHAAVRDEVGFRVEVAGMVDETAKTIVVHSVKRLSPVTAMCMLLKKGTQ